MDTTKETLTEQNKENTAPKRAVVMDSVAMDVEMTVPTPEILEKIKASPEIRTRSLEAWKKAFESGKYSFNEAQEDLALDHLADLPYGYSTANLKRHNAITITD